MTKEAVEMAAQMQDPRVIQRETALREVRGLISELDPEAGLRMQKACRGRETPSTKRPDDSVAFLAEALATLAALEVERLRPRRRGRPRKTVQ